MILVMTQVNETLTGDSGTNWQPMSTAPHDGTRIIAKCVPDRKITKHHEHVIRWDTQNPIRSAWRSSTSYTHHRDEHFEAWRPLDDAAIEVLRQRNRKRDARRRRPTRSTKVS